MDQWRWPVLRCLVLSGCPHGPHVSGDLVPHPHTVISILCSCLWSLHTYSVTAITCSLPTRTQQMYASLWAQGWKTQQWWEVSGPSLHGTSCVIPPGDVEGTEASGNSRWGLSQESDSVCLMTKPIWSWGLGVLLFPMELIFSLLSKKNAWAVSL